MYKIYLPEKNESGRSSSYILIIFSGVIELTVKIHLVTIYIIIQ